MALRAKKITPMTAAEVDEKVAPGMRVAAAWSWRILAVAAVIGEPISSAAGLHVPSPKYWQMLRETCDKYGVLLICDEVINGFGRTGKMFAQELFGIQGDIMTIAKALSSGYAPIAAAVVSDKVYDIFKEKDQVPMGHLLTFGGHPVACAAAIRNLEIFDEENLVEKGNEMGTYLGQQLETLTSHPSVGQVRGVGMVWGLDMVANKETREKFAKDVSEEVRQAGPRVS